MIDTHAHLNFKDFNEDYKQVIKDSIDNGVETIINVGSDFQTSEKAIKIAGENEICYAAVGIHPIHTDRVEGMQEEEIFEKLVNLAKGKKIVAIGETGLDYYHLPSEQKKKGKVTRAQKQLFQIHLNLARKTNLFLILHCRDAYDDLLQIINETIKQWNNEIMMGVVHCFCGSLEIARRFLDLGLYVGFTGMVTYPGNENLSQVIREIPLEKILVETDCPYLPPQEKRGERNLPYYVKYTIQKIAEMKGLDYKEMEKTLSKNATNAFNLSIT
ncbi:MAG: TatD family hydrolase [Patescibacteria group bacterium]|nr:TatD family hydrolase [Patescibacteria group bacterium]